MIRQVNTDMENAFDELVDSFKDRGMTVRELMLTELLSHEDEWVSRFVPSDKRDEAKHVIYDYGGYPWHIFSYEIVACIEKEDAVRAFDRVYKNKAVLMNNIRTGAYEIGNISELKAADLEPAVDITLTDIDFKWTYSKTYDFVGPYFYIAE